MSDEYVCECCGEPAEDVVCDLCMEEGRKLLDELYADGWFDGDEIVGHRG